MKKLAVLATVLLAFAASPAWAQGGLNLSFSDCGTFGVSMVAVNCATNTGSTLFIHASVFPAAAMTKFASATCTIDIKIGGGSLPPWWQTLSGQCRANSIGMSFDPLNNNTNCPGIWGGNPNVPVVTIQQGAGGPDYVRLNGVAALFAGSEVPLEAGTEQWVCRVTINKANTLTCSGCALPATIVLSEVSLQGPPDPTQRITAPAYNSCIGLKGGLAFCPGVVPVQNRTWGMVKSAYK